MEVRSQIDHLNRPSNEKPGQAEIESSEHVSDFFETKSETTGKEPAKTEPVFQETEFVEPEPPGRSRLPAIQEEPEKSNPEKVKPGTWTVPEAYLVFLGSSGRAERITKEYQWDLKWWHRQKPLAEITIQHA